jgi:hypothetical protein
MTLIQVRRDTSSNWASGNPTLALGEPAWDSTNSVFKIGDGATAWNTLPQVGASQNLLSPVKAVTRGDETYTIASGSVTQIAGTTIQGVTMSIGDRILIPTAPASSGAGTLRVTTTQPANGVYVVTNATTNLTVTRTTDLSGLVHPAGKIVYVQAGTWNGTNLLIVDTPANLSAFTYGTSTMHWKVVGGEAPSFDSVLVNTASGFSIANGTGSTTIAAQANVGDQTLTLPVGTRTLWASLLPTALQTSNYTATPGELVMCDGTAGTFTVTLPTAPANGVLVGVKTNTGFMVTIAAGGSDTFNVVGGIATQNSVLTNQVNIFQYYNGVWLQVSQAMPIGQLDARYLTPAGVQTATNKTMDTASNTFTGFTWAPEMVCTSGAVADGYNDMPGGIAVEPGPNAHGVYLDAIWLRVGDLAVTNSGGDVICDIYGGDATTQGTLIVSITLTNGANNVISTLGSPYALSANAVVRAYFTKGSSTVNRPLHVQLRGRYQG